MVARSPIEIALAGQTFSIRPLTINQVEALEGVVGDSRLGHIERGRRIIEIGLSRDHSEAARAVSEMESDMGEVATAMSAILKHGGFLPAVPGEAAAAAPISASTGEASVAG